MHSSKKITRKPNTPLVQTTPPQKLEVQARGVAIDKANACHGTMKEAALAMTHLTLGAVQSGLELGMWLQEATGKAHQLDKRSFLALQEQGLSREISFDMARHALSMVARRGATYRFKNLADAREELTPLLVGLNLVEAPHRLVQLAAGPKTISLWLINDFQKTTLEYEKQMKDSPLESLSPDTLETIIAKTQRFHDDHEKAVRLLKAKQRG